MKNIFLLSTFLFSLTSFAQRVDIHPQAFNPGGWKVDVQFMDVMGSPYLLAHGNGIRCLDAKAVANIPEAGEWRIYVRSRSWVDGAGAFKIKVKAKLSDNDVTRFYDFDGNEITVNTGKTYIALCPDDDFPYVGIIAE